MLPLTEADQQYLLRLARRAVEGTVRGREATSITDTSPSLNEPCGAFVTLHKKGRLRGCIGYVEAFKPLVQTVCDCAVAAATQDPRFRPITADEIPSLHIEISILSPLADISPEKVEVGTHGLVVSRGFHRGLLLPQVAVEWNWDREEFLTQTCLKAGLPSDAWRKGAKVQTFTAQVFGEPEPHQFGHD